MAFTNKSLKCTGDRGLEMTPRTLQNDCARSTSTHPLSAPLSTMMFGHSPGGIEVFLWNESRKAKPSMCGSDRSRKTNAYALSLHANASAPSRTQSTRLKSLASLMTRSDKNAETSSSSTNSTHGFVSTNCMIS